MTMTIGPGRALAVACVFAAALVAGCGGEKPEAMVTSAKGYLAKNDPKAAAIQLKNVLQKNPDNAEARFLLGRASLETDDLPAAEKELRKALELGYPAGVVNPVLAHVLVRKGEYKKVIDEFTQVDASTPQGTAELQTAIGDAHLGVGDSSSARKAYIAARTADPQSGPALIGEARMTALANDLKGALQQTDAAIAAAPSKPEGWQLKGDILTAEGQRDGAIAAYRKAIEVKRDYVAAHAALLSALLQSGKPEDAAKALATMQEIAPKHPQTYYMEALVRMQEKNYTAARDAVQEYLRVLPENPSGLLLAASIDYQLRAYAQAEANLLKVLQRAPNQEYARRMLIGTYVERGQAAKALEALKPLLGKIDKDAGMLNVAGEVYLRNGEPAVAATYFQKAAMVDPAGTSQKTGLALTRLAQGDTQRGVEELEAAAAKDPGVRPDLVLIAASLQQRQFDKALAAIDALEKKQPDKSLAPNLRGLALLGKKDVAGARKSFERAVAIDSGFLPAVANLARLDLADKKPADAEKRFQDVITKNPGNSQALLALAELRARNKGSPEEIVGLLNKAVAAAPSEIGPRLALINYYLRTREPKKAVAAAQDAQAAIRDRPELLEALGQAQQAAGDSNQALASFNRLAEAMPNSPMPLLRLAGVQARMKDYDSAAQSLRKALAMQPDLISAQKGLIVLDLGADKPTQALTIAREVQKQRPKEIVGYVLEGDIHASRKEWSQAVAAYSAGLKQAPNSEAAAKLHAVFVAAGKPAEADRAAATWLKEHPDDNAYQVYLAESAVRRGDYASSLKRYEALLAKQPDNALLLNNFAWAAGKLNDPRALEYAERANKVAPNQAPIMDTLGVLLVEKGDANRGVELLRKATELAPQAASVRLNLAKGLLKVGQKDAARKELDELAKLGDKDPAHEEVARLIKTL